VLDVLDDVALLVVRRPEADDRAQEDVGVGQVVHDREQALADFRGKRVAGPLLTGSLVLRQRDQAGRAGADAFLHWSRGIDEREGEVAPLSPDHEC